MPRKPAPTAPALLTLTEAAHLTNMPKAYLKELAERGVVAAHVLEKGGDRKLRISVAALAAAGLVRRPNGHAESAGGELAELARVVREQNERIAALEEQRFQLAGQLGAAMERTRALEERLLMLAADSRQPSAVRVGTVVRGAITRISRSGAGRLLTPRLDAVVAPIRFRLPARNDDPSLTADG